MNEKYTKLINIEVEIELERGSDSHGYMTSEDGENFKYNPETKKFDIAFDLKADREKSRANSIMHRLSVVLHEYADAIYEEVHKETVWPDEPGYVPPKVGHLPDYFTASNGVKMVLNMKTKPGEC